ncbi:hypothetical protein [Sorangium sp. So ce1153]|uniref:hypothetical protein n=1 Tax=Sorangium sp. So ce1153 TaxID=3133333 RepID=UPI003F61EFC6
MFDMAEGNLSWDESRALPIRLSSKNDATAEERFAALYECDRFGKRPPVQEPDAFTSNRLVRGGV